MDCAEDGTRKDAFSDSEVIVEPCVERARAGNTDGNDGGTDTDTDAVGTPLLDLAPTEEVGTPLLSLAPTEEVGVRPSHLAPALLT